MAIDEFAIYDLYSKLHENKKSLDSSSTASVGNNPMTTRSHYQVNIEKPFDSSSMVSARNNLVTALSHYRMVTYSINDLVQFVKDSMTKIQ